MQKSETVRGGRRKEEEEEGDGGDDDHHELYRFNLNTRVSFAIKVHDSRSQAQISEAGAVIMSCVAVIHR